MTSYAADIDRLHALQPERTPYNVPRGADNPLQVMAVGPLVAETLADSGRYPEDPGYDNVLTAGLRTLNRDERGSAARAYMRELCPREETSVLSLAGSGAVVLEAGDTVFKVHMHPHGYEYTENEAAALVKAHRLGIGPRLRVLIDAGREYRTENPGGDRRHWKKVPIPRIDGGGLLPVTVMDKLDVKAAKELPLDRRLEELVRLAKVLLENKLTFNTDAEIGLDMETNSVRLLDIGSLQRIDDANIARIVRSVPGLMRTSDALAVRCLTSLGTIFAPQGATRPSVEQIKRAFQSSGAGQERGIDDVRKLMNRLWRPPLHHRLASLVLPRTTKQG